MIVSEKEKAEGKTFEERKQEALALAKVKLTEAGFAVETVGRYMLTVRLNEPDVHVDLRAVWHQHGSDVGLSIGTSRARERRVYGTRNGKGYDWPGIIATVRRKIQSGWTYAQAALAQQAREAESKRLLAEIAATAGLAAEPQPSGDLYLRPEGALRWRTGLDIVTRVDVEADERTYDLNLRLGNLPRAELEAILAVLKPTLVEHGLAKNDREICVHGFSTGSSCQRCGREIHGS